MDKDDKKVLRKLKGGALSSEFEYTLGILQKRGKTEDEAVDYVLKFMTPSMHPIEMADVLVDVRCRSAWDVILTG